MVSMVRPTALQLTILLALAPIGASHAVAQSATLTPLDYVEIRQLVAKYAYALDTGAGNGAMYADLFTPDGVFTGMNQGADGRSYTGRETLAGLPGRMRGSNYVSHFIMNEVITPAPGGATGTQYLAILDIGEGNQPSAVRYGGRYEDVYAKTAQGWRFKSRTFYQSEGGPDPLQLKKQPAAVTPSPGPVPAAPRPAGTLTVEDYLEIDQLVTKYAYALDTGANDGFMYADLFAPGAEFIRPPTKGRDNLAQLALDQPHGLQYVRHYLTNKLIEPAADGATGKQYLVVIDIGQGGQPSSIFIGGHYEDVYVKTAQGWRFKRREFIPSRTAAEAQAAGQTR